MITKKPVIISVNPFLWSNFKSYCQDKGYTLSKRITMLVEEDLKYYKRSMGDVEE